MARRVSINEKGEPIIVDDEPAITKRSVLLPDGRMRIGITVGYTLNEGNYQNIRMDASLEGECYCGDEAEAYDELLQTVLENLSDLTAASRSKLREETQRRR